MGASLVGGGDPQEQPELVAGGRRGRERRDTGPEGREGGPSGGDARPASGRTSVPVPLHPVDPALSLVD